MEYAIGIDLGGTKIEMGIVDEIGRVYDHQRLRTSMEHGAQGVEQQMCEGVRSLLSKNDLKIIGVGIGVAGQIHKETGEVDFAPNLQWHHVPLQLHMESALQLPVKIFNDVRAITYAEWLYGAGMGYDDLLCIFIGTGIGGGIVSGGQLLAGHTNIFGEVGHVTVDVDGPLCSCGKKGCLEVYVAGWGIAARAREAIFNANKGEHPVISLLPTDNLEKITAKEVIEAFHNQDPIATAVIHRCQEALVAGVASLLNAYNPACLIVGGGVIDGMPEMIPIIDREVRKIALRAATSSLKIVRAQLGNHVGIIGSAAGFFLSRKGNKIGSK